MRQVAFATYEEPVTGAVVDDDRLAADVLASHGVPVTFAAWDDPAVDWPRFACVVIRSAWDYHRKADRYADWLRARAADGTRLWNPPAAVLANLDKRYLAGLADRGVEVVPTEYLAAADGRRLGDVLASRRWDEVVIKPAVSAGADGTWRSSLATAAADQPRFEAQARALDLLVQPYAAEVAAGGEWSLVFFAGRFSHAIVKRPAGDDFRVQRHFGGSVAAADPSPALVEQARTVLSRVDSPLLYARVDGIDRAGRFVLMELEINEPYLFLGRSAGAAARFVEAIEAVM
jgi:glutathione synthase/RimK-type ligase-like ATP-grasp enzyme